MKATLEIWFREWGVTSERVREIFKAFNSGHAFEFPNSATDSSGKPKIWDVVGSNCQTFTKEQVIEGYKGQWHKLGIQDPGSR